MNLGVDLGGTSTKLALVDSVGRIAVKGEIPTRVSEGVDSWVGHLTAAARALGPYERAGVAVPGVLDRTRGAVVNSPNLHAWDGYPLKASLDKALGVSVVLENDANAAALGEARFGAHRDWSDFLLTTVGTGVGGGLILGGDLFLGPGGMAGEVGHFLAEPGGRVCGCGNRGCVEAIASVTGMLTTAREHLAGNGVNGMNGVKVPESGKELAEWLAGDDVDKRQAARAAFDRAGRALGIAFAAVTVLLDIRRFLVGGGGAESLPALLPSIRAELRDHVYGRPLASIEIAAASLGNDAGVLGAASLAGR